MVQIQIVAAIAANRGIGLNNQLAWKVPSDLKSFKTLTVGSPVIMGRKTFESIGRPLPGRLNVVLTRSKEFLDLYPAQHGSLSVQKDLDAAVAELIAAGHTKISIIGGSEVYALGLRIATDLYLSEFKVPLVGADVFFPQVPAQIFREASRQTMKDPQAEPSSFAEYDFVHYVRV